MARDRKPPKAILPLMIWDTVWKLVAIRRAIQLKHYKMIPVLAIANSAGLLPMGYLWKNRGKTAERADLEDPATS